jgi:hypothetical protein
MTSLTGSVSAYFRSRSMITIPDQPGHTLMLGEAAGTQQTSDPLWNNASLTYSAVTEMMNDEGTQRGYFVNSHANGDRDWGSFEGHVTTVSGILTVEGTYQITGGSGTFSSVTGSGTFTTRLVSADQIEVNYEGTYQLAAAKAAG